MKIEFEGRVYDYDLDDLNVEQALKIEKHVGGTLLDWEQGMEKVSVPCFQALGWLILHDGDLSVPIDGLNFKVLKLARVWGEALERERAAAAQEEPDPTRPAGASTPPTPGSTRFETGPQAFPAPDHVNRTVSGPTG